MLADERAGWGCIWIGTEPRAVLIDRRVDAAVTRLPFPGPGPAELASVPSTRAEQ
jgi:hypothetical protein